jgi:DNA topoisomerase-2
LKKNDGKKKIKLRGIPKLEDANKAGTIQSSKCILNLTEGDSAKAFVMGGIKNKDYEGVFPLKGKLLNVRDEKKVKTIDKNKKNKKIRKK